MTTAQKSAAAAAIAALLVSGWTGHALGSAHGREQQLSLATGRQGSTAPLVTTTVDRRPVADDPAKAFERLLSGADRRTWAVVSRLDVGTMPVWLGKLRELQARAPRGSSEWKRLAEIESALYFHWADADPQAAWKEVAAIPKSNDDANDHTEMLVKSVLAAWMRRAPDEAFTASKNHPDHDNIARDMLILTWTPETLEENLAKHPDRRRDLLGWFCGSVVGDEAKREAVLRFLLKEPAPKDADWGRMLFFRAWGYDDFDAAMAKAEALELPDMVKLIFGDNLSLNPAKTMPWAISKGLKPGGPQWEEGYRDWLARDEEGARAWFGPQAGAWERDGHDVALAGFLAAELANASQLVEIGKGEPTSEQAAAERLAGFLGRWSAKDAAAASAWRDAASKETRDRLDAMPAPR